MTNKSLALGDIVLYPYLWASQHDRGEIAGRKTRPACLVVRLHDAKDDVHHLMLVAITSRQPSDKQRAIEVPETERKRARLTRYPRAWVIVDEYNYDIAERSWYFDSGIEPVGSFGQAFMRQITGALRTEMRRGAKRVDRTK